MSFPKDTKFVDEDVPREAARSLPIIFIVLLGLAGTFAWDAEPVILPEILQIGLVQATILLMMSVLLMYSLVDPKN